MKVFIVHVVHEGIDLEQAHEIDRTHLASPIKHSMMILEVHDAIEEPIIIDDAHEVMLVQFVTPIEQSRLVHRVRETSNNVMVGDVDVILFGHEETPKVPVVVEIDFGLHHGYCRYF